MVTLNTRDELVEFLYGENSTSPDTLVGIARVGGELLDESFRYYGMNDDTACLGDFFPSGDEGEEIVVDREGNILSDYLYY